MNRDEQPEKNRDEQPEKNRDEQLGKVQWGMGKNSLTFPDICGRL